MTDLELYAVPLPEQGRNRAGRTGTTEQQLQAILGSDSGAVESIAPRPGERTLRQDYVDTYAAVRAQELAELANGISSPLPLHAQTGTSLEDAYVTASRAEVEPIDPRGRDSFQRATLTISEAGSVAEDWRATRTAVTQVDHPFGNTLDAVVGIPAAARKLRWLNEETGAREVPTVQATRTTASGRDVDVLHADASSYDDPTAIYEIDYADIGWTDPRVWDDRGNANIDDNSGRTQWQKVFATGHRYDGQAVIENGLVRLLFDEGTNALTVEEWDTGTSSWSRVSLGASDWELFDVDLRDIGLARVRAQIEFRDTTQSPTAFHRLSMRLTRGLNWPIWANEIEGAAVPSGLETLLDPVASATVFDAQAQAGLVPRAEVG